MKPRTIAISDRAMRAGEDWAAWSARDPVADCGIVTRLMDARWLQTHRMAHSGTCPNDRTLSSIEIHTRLTAPRRDGCSTTEAGSSLGRWTPGESDEFGVDATAGSSATRAATLRRRRRSATALRQRSDLRADRVL